MTEVGIYQVLFYLIVLLVCVYPLGSYMALVYEGKPCGLTILFKPLERFIYRCAGIQYKKEMNWISYLSAMLYFNLLGIFLIYAIERLQFFFPLNPQSFAGVTPDLALNTAVSFVTNTNWQAYGGETTLSYLTQMAALTVQNFLSAATGMSLLIAFIRGLARPETTSLGNFWVDVTRSVLYILLPLSFIFSLILVSQGVIQNIKPYQKIKLLVPISYQMTDSADPTKNKAMVVKEQVLPMGPVASQIAIKQLGTNGGGFFNTNSAHPFENPTPLSNFLEMIAILLIPAAFCYTFGVMVSDRRQGLALLLTMLIIFIPFVSFAIMAEQKGNPALTVMGIDQTPKYDGYSGGNMEGKETRIGIANSAIWATATTSASNGSVNSMHDSYMPIGGLVTLWMMHLGEIVFGGVGSGLYGMLVFVIIAVFVAGLMVGRTPEYLGKKIEPYEMKMASLAVLVMPLTVLFFSAIAVVSASGINSIANPGPHGFTEVLYAFTSMGNNNGSAFAGLHANTPFYNTLGSIAMLISRFWIAIPTLAIAGSLAQKKIVPTTSGTLPTHTVIFVFLLTSVIVILGALTFFPTLALGPIVEHLMIWKNYGS